MNEFSITGFEQLDFGQGRTLPPGGPEHGVRIPEPTTGQKALQAVVGFFTPKGTGIELDEEISKGDLLRLTFSMNVPFFKETQKDALVRAVNADGRFNVIASQVTGDRIVLDVEVIQSPFPLALLVGVIAAAGATVFLFLNFEKAEKLVKSATPLVFGVVAVLALLLIGRVLPR